MFVSILLISVFAYIKSYAGIPVEMWAGLMTIGCVGILYTLIGCIIKLVNHSKAKQYNVSERVWCK
ncbi:MAG: hypothetical protein MJ223_03090 [Mycoplasmoidaceae bacterium]|nr:hypothetical protein [Mycoplasmoidaceae bacterium]